MISYKLVPFIKLPSIPHTYYVHNLLANYSLMSLINVLSQEEMVGKESNSPKKKKKNK